MDDDVWADSEEDERIVDHAISSEGQEDGSGEGGSGDKARKGRSSDYDKRMAELEWNKLHRVHGVVDIEFSSRWTLWTFSERWNPQGRVPRGNRGSQGSAAPKRIR